MDGLLRLISLQDANTRVVLLGATALGAAAGLVGALAVLRRRALVGDAMAHAALPGVCAAYLIVGDRDLVTLMLGALVMGVIAAWFISFVKSATRVKEDAVIAITIGCFFGVGVALSRIVQNLPEGNRAGLDGFIFGKAASMVSQDAMLILVTAGAMVLGVALLRKEFTLVCFDRAFAQAQGWPAKSIDLGLMAMVCVCTVVGLPAVGVVLMVALLVIPAAAARFWTDRLGTMLVISGVFGGLAGFSGTVLSATLPAPPGSLTRGWPTGPLVVLCASALFCASMLAAPRRGVLAGAVRRWRLSRRIAMQNLLRDAYEALEPSGDFNAVWSPAELDRAAGRRAAPGVIARAMRAGWVQRAGDGLRLTSDGRQAAARVIRAHRLWELFLIEQADIAPDHVDRDADEIEHVLSAELIAGLESRLIEQGRLPGGSERSPPPSPHTLLAGRGTR